MLAEESTPIADPPAEARPGRSSTRLRRVLAFAGFGAILVIYALRGGGSYDTVAFEEHGLVIWWLVALAVALGLLPRRRPAKVTLALLASLAAYAAWTALSLLWTDSSELTWTELARSLDYLGLVTFAVCVLDERTWRAAIAGVGAGAMVVCAVAVGSRLSPSVFGVDRIDVAYHIDRLSFPFGYWNAVAAWGAMCSALAVAWSAGDTLRLRRAIAAALVPVAGLMTYLSYSRAGVGGVALGAIAVFALSRNRLTALLHLAGAAAGTGIAIAAVRSSSATEIAHATGTRGAGAVFGALVAGMAVSGGVAFATSLLGVDRFRLPPAARRVVGLAALVVALGAFAVAGPHVISKAWHSFTHGATAQSTADPTARLSSLSGSRYPLWKSSIKAFDAHPATGLGAGTIEFWWNEHGTNGEFIRNSHNIWLQNMAELGAPGLALIIAVCLAALAVAGSVLRQARRGMSAGAAAAAVACFLVYLLHATVDWMWESTAVTVLALLAVSAAGARLSDGRLRLPVPARAAIALAATAFAIIQLPGLLSTGALRRSQQAANAGNLSTALAWAHQAVDAEPWSASAYEQRGLVLEAGGRLGDAAADLRRATDREPDNYQHWLVLSRIDTELGQLGSATRDYATAHRLRPQASVFALAPYFAAGR